MNDFVERLIEQVKKRAREKGELDISDREMSSTMFIPGEVQPAIFSISSDVKERYLVGVENLAVARLMSKLVALSE